MLATIVEELARPASQINNRVGRFEAAKDFGIEDPVQIVSAPWQIFSLQIIRVALTVSSHFISIPATDGGESVAVSVSSEPLAWQFESRTDRKASVD